jgi:hypothetical protein
LLFIIEITLLTSFVIPILNGVIFNSFILTKSTKNKIKFLFEHKTLDLKQSINYFFKTYGGARKGDIECYDYGLKVKTEKEKVESFDEWIKVNKLFKFLS